MAYCLRSFVETLEQVLFPHKHYKKWVLDHNHRPQIQSLFENATFLQKFLDDSPPQIQETISSLEDRIMDAAQKAADILETYITDQILLNLEDQSFTIFPPDLGEVIRIFEDAKQELSMIKDASRPSDHILSPPVSSTRYPVSKNTVVGVEEDLNQLRDRLTSQVTELDVIPIVGMGGMGKTTLARILYDEFSSKLHFDRCAWVTVSQSYDPQRILRTLLEGVTKQDKSVKKTSDLITTLYQTLVGRRYLIVLDDIWSSKAWDDVQSAFARDKQRSRIIVTTRENSLVEYVNSNGHEMHLINDDKSWELLRRKVFVEESCPRELEEVGKRIALKCGGLPLALQVISGLLAQSERSTDYWEYVAHNVSSLVAKTDDQFDGIFSWSFAHLPHHLKPCFLYIGVFPEDEEIPESRLIQLWIAEGFLYPVSSKSLEEAAEMHLNALVDRNLIFVHTKKWNGKAKSYGIHDLLRDLCLRKAQEKKFLYVYDLRADILQKDISGHGVSIHIPEICRVCIHMPQNDTEHDYGSLKLASFARSLILNGHGRSEGFVSRMCCKSLLLRVLDVGSATYCYFQEMVLPLVNLRYLSVFSCSLAYIKARVFSLQNLQTLQADYLESLAVIDHLPQLRRLQFDFLEDEKSTDSFEVSPHDNLQYLSRVPLHKLSYLLEKLPNLRTLHSFGKNSDFVDLTCFQKIESLSIDGQSLGYTKAVLIFPQSIKKLKLFSFEISQTLLNEIGILPRLQYLKFNDCQFENRTWEPSEGEFCQLQYLEIDGSNLDNWLATDLHFPKLQHLVIRYCRYLNEIPNDFGEIETLESINVNLCKDSVFASARTILQKQLELGNDLFQLRLRESVEDNDAAHQLYCFETDVVDNGLTIVSKECFNTKTAFPYYLRYLKLEKCVVSQTVFSAAGVLVQLEKFILENCDFDDSTWEPSEDQFCQLQHLEIKGARGLSVWLVTEIHFPLLKHLVLQNCYDLIEIPNGIGRIKTLEIVEVKGCKPSLGDFAWWMLKEQRKLGNTLFQIQVDLSIKDIEDKAAACQPGCSKRDVEDKRLTIVHEHFFLPETIFPHFIRYLRLENCRVNQTVLGAAGVLVELQTLVLKKCDFEDSTWEPSEGQFCQLELLQISNAKNLVKWFATEIHFPVLRCLGINECLDLSEIPIGIGQIEYLEMIKVDKCKPSVLESATKILKERRKLGNNLPQFWFHGVLMDEEDLPEPRTMDLLRAFEFSDLEEDVKEVKWVLPEMGESSKGSETQVPSSSLCPSHDLFLAAESFGLAYSLDAKQARFANRTSNEGRMKQNVRHFSFANPSFIGRAEGSKGLETQVSSSPFDPSQDFIFTSDSLGLDSEHSYSLDSSQNFANRTSDTLIQFRLDGELVDKVEE